MHRAALIIVGLHECVFECVCLRLEEESRSAAATWCRQQGAVTLQPHERTGSSSPNSLPPTPRPLHVGPVDSLSVAAVSECFHLQRYIELCCLNVSLAQSVARSL